MQLLSACSRYILSTHQFEMLDELDDRLSLLRSNTIVGLEHADECPLGPMIVIRSTSAHLAVPVK